MHIEIAESDDEIATCFDVMYELRPHLIRETFVERVRGQYEAGYRLARMSISARVEAVAGFRLCENLAWGRFLYVDDLVTRADARSLGHGHRMIEWLLRHARDRACDALHLDSGTQRKGAHRFYEREGLSLTSFHFCASIDDGSSE